jgi:hypothetical protein
MSIDKYNNYIPSQDVVNLSNNVPIDIIGKERTAITVNFLTSPATVTILNGSLIEHNNDFYLVNADYSFQMLNVNHNYLIFNGSSFSSAATFGTFDTEKQGYYNGNDRILKFYIDQTNECYFNVLELIMTDKFRSIQHDHVKVRLSSNWIPPANTVSIIPFDIKIFDDNNRWNTGTYRFTAVKAGYYMCIVFINLYLSAAWGSHNVTFPLGIRKNGEMSIIYPQWPRLSLVLFDNNPYSGQPQSGYCHTIVYLKDDDYIEFMFHNVFSGNTYDIYLESGEEKSYACILKLL